ncbi:MAG: nuclear transport factor 2 family protein, partial [Bacteroidota bacterium]
MKFIKEICLALLLCTTSFGVNNSLIAQNNPFTDQYKSEMINRICELLRDAYVFPEIGAKAAEKLLAEERAGQFKSYKTPEPLANALTKSIYQSTKDKHLVVSVRNRNHTPETAEDQFAARLDERNYYRKTNAGFKSITKLEDNIGYLELSGFYGLDLGQEVADMAMKLLSTSDAIIIDLRKNYGGRGDMGEYLMAHFFEAPVKTSKVTKRRGNNFTTRIGATPELEPRQLMPDVPLFVLLSEETISAAEGFSFGLQIYDRATLIGETTAGGANPGDLIAISDDLQFFVSDVSVTHPENDTSWEGVGVVPDIKVDAEKALKVAIQEAKKAAAIFRNQSEEKAKLRLLALEEKIENFTPEMSTKTIVDAYLECKEDHLFFWEWNLNNLGYRYLGQPENAKLGEAILEANKVLYPNSANVYDSYGDALMNSNQFERAILAYKKAVDLGTRSKHENLEQFQTNLKNTREKLAIQQSKLSTDAAISRTLLDYIEGTSIGDPEKLRRAFHPDFNLYSVTQNGTLSIRSGETYIGYFPKGEKTGRTGKIVSIDAQGDVAVAKVEITMANSKVYVDYFLLLQYEGSWKIVHKSFDE